MTRFYFILFPFVLTIKIYSQQTPVFTQFNENLFYYNPACAGMLGNTNISFIAREQWIGYVKFPSTYTFTAETRSIKRGYKLNNSIFGKLLSTRRTKAKIGAGFTMYSDRNGLLRNTGLGFTYAYHINTQKYQYSFGFAPVLNQLSINSNEVSVIQKDDPLLSNINQAMYISDFNLGLLVTGRVFYSGISSLNILNSSIKFGNPSLKYKNARSYFFFTGSSIGISKEIELKSIVLLKMNDHLRIQGDITNTFNLFKRFSLGVNFRTNGEISFNAGMRFYDNIMSQHLFVGYSFDYPYFNTLRISNFGSHEIFIRYTLGSDERRLKWMDRY